MRRGGVVVALVYDDLQVQSFHEMVAADVDVSSMTDLCDGVFLAKIMHQMYVY